MLDGLIGRLESWLSGLGPGGAPADKADIDHFPDPRLSCWQSAVGDIASGPNKPSAIRHHPMVEAARIAAHAHTAPGTMISTDHMASCAKTALDLALAKLDGRTVRARELQAQFEHLGECDPLWLECIARFEAYYTIARQQKVYTPWQQLSDFVIDVPTRCRIGIIGDWGTGEPRALALLEALAKTEPDVVIHLGDIYYSCTAAEADRFVQDFARAFPVRKPRVFSLCGNHDMYSGGKAYHDLLGQIGQPASFFCLRNADWQILAGDTGYNDFNPIQQGSVASAVQDRDQGSPYSELDWHRDKFATASGRRSILLTHHQPFTRSSPIEGKPVNENLLGQFAPFADAIALWLWGHEHNQVIYAPFQAVAKGRCIGASAVPTSGSERPYAVPKEFAGMAIPALLSAERRLKLGVDRRLGLYHLGYALIDLEGTAGRASYWQFDSSKSVSTEMHREIL